MRHSLGIFLALALPAPAIAQQCPSEHSEYRALIESSPEQALPCLTEDFDANAYFTSFGLAPLHVARDPQVVERLLELGADPNIRMGDDDKDTPLILIGMAGPGWEVSAEEKRRLIEMLIDAGADVDGRNMGGVTPLFWAAHTGAIDVVDILLEAGADPLARSSSGETPLGAAADRDPELFARMVMESGAHDVALNNGSRPIHYAATRGDVALIEHLLAAGVDVNARNDDGYTAIQEAAMLEDPESLKVLLDAGADPDIPDEGGYNALHLAAMYGYPEAVALLLEAGADGSAQTNDGMTPVQLVDAEEGNPAVKESPVYNDLINSTFE